MFNELPFFDEFLHHVYPQCQHLPLGVNEFETYRRQLSDAAVAVRNGMVKFVFESPGRAEVELYIQQHQRCIILYSDSVDHFIHQQPNACAYWKELLRLCSRYLEGLLSFVETYFSRYFNQDEGLPKGYLLPVCRELEDKLKACKDLFSRIEVTDRLACISLLPVENFLLVRSPQPRTFRRLLWIKECMREVLSLPERALKKGLEKELLQLYVYLNFNSLPIHEYITDGYKNEISQCVSVREKLEQLSLFIKDVNLMIEKPEFALCPNRPSLKQMLQYWLQEEYDHLIIQREQRPVDSGVKIGASLTVPQLAYLVHLLEKSKLLHANNQKQLIKFFATNFTTLHQGQISPISFKNRYYNADRPTAVAVRDMLLKMVHESKAELP